MGAGDTAPSESLWGCNCAIRNGIVGWDFLEGAGGEVVVKPFRPQEALDLAISQMLQSTPANVSKEPGSRERKLYQLKAVLVYSKRYIIWFSGPCK